MRTRLIHTIMFALVLQLILSCTPEVDSKQLADVSTSMTVAVTFDAAQSGGFISFDGNDDIVSRGVCYSVLPDPTVNDSVTVDGSGLGDFYSFLSGLSPATTYYVRAYATNSTGTAYGEEVQFTTYGTVTNPVTGRSWMDRNLGSNRVAISLSDVEAYGDLYQWGRGTDGHEKRYSSSTDVLSTGDHPGHGKFILSTTIFDDWRNPQRDYLWQGVRGINNPCPDGFRLPTREEWMEELNTWSQGAFESVLKLPSAGYRSYQQDTIRFGSGTNSEYRAYGFYWSSTLSVAYAYALIFYIRDTSSVTTHALMRSYPRAYGYCVRCIKD